MAAEKAKHKGPVKTELMQREPEYTIQIGDAKALRKEVLEGLREAIIFMQGYEKFLHIQRDKMMLFHKLKSQTQELQTLVNGKLRRYLPKGKLKAITPRLPKEVQEQEEEQQSMMPSSPLPQEEEAPAAELDELESQLQQIESKLRGME